MGIKNPEKYLAPETNPLDIQTAEDKMSSADYQQYVQAAMQAQTTGLQNALGAGGLGAGTGLAMSGTANYVSYPQYSPYATAADVETICRTVMKEMIAELVDKLSFDGIKIPIEELKKHLEK